MRGFYPQPPLTYAPVANTSGEHKNNNVKTYIFLNDIKSSKSYFLFRPLRYVITVQKYYSAHKSSRVVINVKVYSNIACASFEDVCARHVSSRLFTFLITHVLIYLKKLIKLK